MSLSGLFIGRFQPPHEGHIHALRVAASQVDRLYILVGSANSCRSIRNPWTFEERRCMLHEKLVTSGTYNFEVLPLNDHPYDDEAWVEEVEQVMNSVGASKPVLFGHTKEGNDYLEWFPIWNFVEIETSYDVNATQIREEMFRTNDPRMPQCVKDDWAFYQREKALFANYPFPETLNFNCADAVVVCNKHVLLVKRLRAPGAGTWALPGGFKNANETFLDCALRELKEETGLEVNPEDKAGSDVLYDSPKRSYGIPRNTLATHFVLKREDLPAVKASDDAAECRWIPLEDVLNGLPLYDDHAGIITGACWETLKPAYLKHTLIPH